MTPTLARARTIKHEEQLTLVEHLDELRTRIIICIGAIVVSGSVCFWQNQKILEIANDPIPNDVIQSQGPITLGPAEAFTTTLTLAGYFAIVVALPVILYQAYAYVLPAFSDAERRKITPLVLMAPLLFIAGALFTYFLILPPAMEFLTNFNEDQFNNQLRAKDYYSFFAMMLIVMGLAFEMPLFILALVRLGITTPEKLRKNRRYAILAIAVIAALLPTLDPVTLLLEMIPIILLFEGSIVLASAFSPSGEDHDPTEEATD